MLIASTFETFPDISEKSSYPPKKQAVKLRSEMLIGINATLKLLHTCFFIAYSTCICQAKWRFANLLQRRHNDEGWIMPDSLHINPECRAKQENSHGLTGFFFFFFASTEFNCIDSRSLDWRTSDHVQVTTSQMGSNRRKQLFQTKVSSIPTCVSILIPDSAAHWWNVSTLLPQSGFIKRASRYWS